MTMVLETIRVTIYINTFIYDQQKGIEKNKLLPSLLPSHTSCQQQRTFGVTPVGWLPLAAVLWVHLGTPRAQHRPGPHPASLCCAREALRQLAEIKTSHYLSPDMLHSGSVGLDRAINTHRAQAEWVSWVLDEGIAAGSFFVWTPPLPPSLLFTPLPTFSDLHLPKKGQHFTTPLCAWSTPRLL